MSLGFIVSWNEKLNNELNIYNFDNNYTQRSSVFWRNSSILYLWVDNKLQMWSGYSGNKNKKKLCFMLVMFEKNKFVQTLAWRP